MKKRKTKDRIKTLEKEIEKLRKKLEKLRDSRVLLLFFPPPASIQRESVSDVYEKLKNTLKKPVPKLVVIVDSAGGDIDAAYHMVKILRRFAKNKLTFIVPRFAKSAATLLVCGGDSLVMGPTSEIGPLDPQIVDLKRGEVFSPLAISSTIEFLENLIREGEKKKKPEKVELAKMLVDKLLPLSLGQHLKSLEIGKVYLEELLKTGMFKNDKKRNKKIKQISSVLVKRYPHHGYCIDIEEAKKIGLKVEIPSEKEWEIIWNLYKKYKEITKIIIKGIV